MKVVCFGTFDVFHKGHEYFLKRSGNFGDELIVVVARDETVKEVKGDYPMNNENKRVRKIKNLEYVDDAILGNIKDKYSVIEKLAPDVISLGYDQEAFVSGLEEELEKRNISAVIIRVDSYKPEVYKSSKMPALVFFKYAFPCLQVQLDKGRITDDEYEKLKKMYFDNLAPDKKRLVELFPEAFRRMKQIKEIYWNVEAVREYFLHHHNRFIYLNDGDYKFFPESFKKLCRVKKGQVVEPGKFMKISVGSKEMQVISNIKAKKGDVVSVHLGFAVENLSEL